MEFSILNRQMETIAIVDSAESLIWTDRFCGYGDFEILAPAESDLIEYAQQNYYVWMRDSRHLMVIESRTVETGYESGSKVLIVGRSLESFLERRILWTQTVLDGELQAQLQSKVFNPNIINPSNTKRKINNFRYLTNPEVTALGLNISMQSTGDSIYDVVQDSCTEAELGWELIYNWNDSKFDFKLLVPTDRSYDNVSNNAYVVFSPDFENLLDSSYYEDNAEYKNIALVAGEGEVVGVDRKTTSVYSTSSEPSDLDRREMFVDARDIQSETSSGTMPEADYIKALKTRGKEYLDSNISATNMEGEIEATQTFVYGSDFFLGDYVQIKNEFGIEGKAQVSEVIFSQDTNGYKVVPTFKMIS